MCSVSVHLHISLCRLLPELLPQLFTLMCFSFAGAVLALPALHFVGVGPSVRHWLWA